MEKKNIEDEEEERERKREQEWDEEWENKHFGEERRKDRAEAVAPYLWQAVEMGNVQEVKRLCKKWSGDKYIINWAHPEFFDSTPLHMALRSPKCTEILLSTLSIDVNKGDKDGHTPLWLAAYLGQTEIVQALLAAPGIDLNKAPTGGKDKGKSPLTIVQEQTVAEDRKKDEDAQTSIKILSKLGKVANLLMDARAKTTTLRKGGKNKTKKNKRSKKNKRKTSNLYW